MATPEITIKGSAARAKLRNPPMVALFDVLSIGIYGAYWYFMVNTELAALGRARGNPELGDNPTRSLLALVPGIILIVPAIISIVNTVKRIRAAERQAGIPEDQRINIAAGALMISILPPIGSAYAQSHLNAVYRVEGEA